MSKYYKEEDIIKAIESADTFTMWQEQFAINTLKSLPTIEVSEDCVSKHDIWKIIEDNAYWVRYNENSTEKGMTLTGINQALNECPSVVPSREEGEWLLSDLQSQTDNDNGNYAYVCTNCHHTDTHAKTQKVPYCWYCGAKMRSE